LSGMASFDDPLVHGSSTLLNPISHEDASTSLGKQLGNCRTDARPRASHQRGLVLKRKHVGDEG
jgi:hypothetical protein